MPHSKEALSELAEVRAIVKECARFANDYVADSFGVHYSVGDEIKKHFGIEDDLNNVRFKANYRYDIKEKNGG